METQAPCYRVEQLGIGDCDGDDLRDIELEKVQIPENSDVVCVADEDEDEKGQRKEVENRGDDGGVAAGFGSSHGLSAVGGW